MKVIRQAGNNNGDCVIFWRLDLGAEIQYQVVLLNNRTEQTLKAYSMAIDAGDFGRKHLERAAQVKGMEAFKEACQFIGIDSGLDE